MDSSRELVKPEDYVYAKNFINNDVNTSRGGVGGNILGNTKIPNLYAESGDAVIGSAKYEKGNGNVVFVFNSTPSKHKILLVTETSIKLLLKADWLNFRGGLLNNPKCYDDYVVWTDGVNEPRMFNIQWMLKYQELTNHTNTPIYDFNEISNAGNTSVYFAYNGDVYELLDSTTGCAVSFPVPAPTSPPQCYYITHGTAYDTYYLVTEDTIKLIADPPLMGLSYDYYYDDAIKYNNIFGKMFSFSYRYEYRDGRLSVFSPFSTINVPQGGQTEDGYKTDNSANTIGVNIPTGNKEVIKVHVAFRDLKNPVAIRLLTVLDKYDTDGNMLIPSDSVVNNQSFLNDKVYQTIDYSDFIRPFDFVPKLTVAQDILNDGRVIFGDIKKQVPDSDYHVDGSVEVISTTVNSRTTDTVSFTEAAKTATIGANTVDYRLYSLNIPAGYQAGMKYKMNFTVTYKPVSASAYSKTYTVEYVGGYFPKSLSNNDKLLYANAAFLSEIRKKIFHEIEYRIPYCLSNPCPWSPSYPLMSQFRMPQFPVVGTGTLSPPNNSYMISRVDDVTGYAIPTPIIDVQDAIDIGLVSGDINPENFIIAEDIDISSLNYENIKFVKNSFTIEYQDVSVHDTIKSNSVIEVGVQYYDKSLRSTGYTKIDTVNTGSLSSWGVLGGDNIKTKALSLDLTIISKPPIDAYYYMPCLSVNKLYSDYIQIMVTGVGAAGAGTIFEINSVITSMVEGNSSTNISPWVLQKGDRVRFIASYTDNSGAISYDYKDTFDKEILSDNSGVFTIDSAILKDNDIVEIYRYRKNIEEEENELFFETGNLMQILNPGETNRYHSGSIQDQTSSLPMITKVEYSDTYIIQRYTNMGGFLLDPAKGYKYFVESDSFSDYYDSFIEVGRPVTMYNNFVSHDMSSMLRFGGKLLPTQSLNYIGRFDWEDYEELSNMYGKIQGIRSIGYTISVYQDRKRTAFYINKSVLKKADGTDQVVISDKILNNKSVSDFDFGCINPESIVVKDTHILFFDAINGCWVRDSKNGMFDVSSYGTKGYSQGLGNIVQDTNVKVIGGYDERTNLFMWVLTGRNEYSTAISFDDKRNAWVSFYDFQDLNNNSTRMIGSLNGYMLSFREHGLVYVHNSDTYNTLFDNDVETLVTSVVNTSPLIIKNFDYMTVSSNSLWIPKEIGDIDVDYGNMISRIRYLEEVEGRYSNEYKRNILYPNGAIRPDENSGESLKGKQCAITLRNSSKEKATITSVISGITPSEKVI
jgi:hypothetical protein